MPLLPPALRKLTPDRLRHDVRLRALGVGLGAIPPRSMHSTEEAELLSTLARDAQRIVEIGVYEGGSAVGFVRDAPSTSRIHLIDPFGTQPGALPHRWAATQWATRRAVARATPAGGPEVVWHARYSYDAVSGWSEPVDLLFIDGDHIEEGVRRDWDDWHALVPVGGRVAFHDSRRTQPGGRGLPGPTAVVDTLFRAAEPVAGWRIEHEVDRTTVVRRTAG